MTIATYLSGTRVSIRALDTEDAQHAGVWYPAQFGTNASRGEAILKAEHESAGRERRLGVVLTESGQLVGGLKLHLKGMHADAGVTISPMRTDADDLRADVLRVVIPWLRDEAEYTTITIEVAADWPLMIAAAEELGMARVVRLRQWLTRPGGRVDMYYYQALNPFWEKAASLAAPTAAERARLSRAMTQGGTTDVPA